MWYEMKHQGVMNKEHSARVRPPTLVGEGDVGPRLAALGRRVQVAADTVAEVDVAQAALWRQRLQLDAQTDGQR